MNKIRTIIGFIIAGFLVTLSNACSQEPQTTEREPKVLVEKKDPPVEKKGPPLENENSPPRSDLNKCPIKWVSSEKVETLPLNQGIIDAFKAKTTEYKTRLQGQGGDERERQKAIVTEGLGAIFSPVDAIKINNDIFYFSQAICDPQRPIAIMYSRHNNEWYAHLYYRSLSNGVWRSSRYFNGAYDKGEHYTQDMLPNPALDGLLNLSSRGQCKKLPAENPIEDVLSFFSFLRQPDFLLAPTKTTQVDFKDEFYYYDNGGGLKDAAPETRQAFFASMTKENMPHNFFPNFLCPNRSYQRSHSIFSKPLIPGQVALENNISVDVFLAQLNNKVIEWHFAYVKGTKEPWIARIRFADSKISLLGSDDDVILSGALTIKPAEYVSQIKNLNRGKDYEYITGTNYADIRKFIQNFPPIIAYKKYKNDTKSW